MKKYLLMFLMGLSLFLLVGCINTERPSYIDTVDCYVNGELVEGSVKYFDEDKYKWKDYDSKIKEKMSVYYTVDASIGDEVSVIVHFYNPELTIKKVKVVYSLNLDYMTNKSNHLFIEEKLEDSSKLIFDPFLLDGSFNVIMIPSWQTDNGIKYQGRKNRKNNYTIWGIHFNLV